MIKDVLHSHGLGVAPWGEENGGSSSNIGVTYEGRRIGSKEGRVSPSLT
jgi:hypothetical protein